MKNTDKLTQWYNQEINAFAFLKLVKEPINALFKVTKEPKVICRLNIPVVGKYTYTGTPQEVMNALDASLAENDRIKIVAVDIADDNTIYIEAHSR